MSIIKKSILIIVAFIFVPALSQAAFVPENVAGRILIQTEEHGEAWYVDPDNYARHYLGRPYDAFVLMQERGIGISNEDLRKIPIALNLQSKVDSDGDGLSDDLEEAIGSDKKSIDSDGDGYSDYKEVATGFDPSGKSKTGIDKNFSQKHSGRIFLQVESRGQAWYVYPNNTQRYYLGKPADAFMVMRSLGLGISNADLAELIIFTPVYDLVALEKNIHSLVNIERAKKNIKQLKWNDEIATTARKHSKDLSRNNVKFTALDAICDCPIIHHEGFDFGLYHDNRLASDGIRYFSNSGENIANIGVAQVSFIYNKNNFDISQIEVCSKQRQEWDNALKDYLHSTKSDSEKLERIRRERQKRQVAFEIKPRLNISEVVWESPEKIAEITVAGWMASKGHRENILNENYDEAGVGTVYTNGYIISTQVFIKRVECGYQGASCCLEDGYEVCFLPYSCSFGVCQ